MKKKPPTRKTISTSNTKFTLRRSDLAIIPMAILTVYAWGSFFADPIDFRMGLFSVWYHNVIFHPGVSMLAIALFGSLYIYRDILRKEVGKYARAIAYIFSVLTIYYVLVQLNVVLSNEPTASCSGLMGSSAKCSEMTLFYAYLYLLNPFSLLLWGVLSAIGAVILVLKTRRELYRKR